MSSNTREAFIEKSINLFCKRSFHTVGIDHIVKHAGVSKATFYNHFESKDHLLVAVLERWAEGWKARFLQQLQEVAGDDPLLRLKSVFKILTQSFEDPYDRGYLFVSTACTLTCEKDPSHRVAKTSCDAIRTLIIELADDARLRQPYEFAQQFHLVIKGAIVSEAIYRRQRAADIGAAVAEKLIDSFLDISAV